jgi:uncharacterized protein YjbJ (UPF0337 family)
MSLPNKDEVKGKVDQAKGTVKENVGRAIGDRDMEDEGTADRASGNVQEGYGQAKRKVGDAVRMPATPSKNSHGENKASRARVELKFNSRL